MLSPGDIVERYEVERELGGGGMARVYKVRHVALGSIHALKVLDPELVVNPEIRGRFLDEGRIQARLKHPHILGITDVVAAPGVAGLVMDYLEGESLDKYLGRLQRPPEPEEVRDIFLQALEGVAFAHEKGVIHRDLKPSNIFLEEVRGRRVVRILDFGIAKVSEPEGGKAMTRAGTRMGTPQYMSPEQIRGARDVTNRSDIFSLGVTLYELATGHVCFQGESDFNIMEKVVRAEFVPVEVAHPGIEPRLAAAIRRAMDAEPERRFASCQEFAAALVSEAPVEPAPAPRVATPEQAPVSPGTSLFQAAKSPQVPKPQTAPEPVQVSSALVEAMRRAPRTSTGSSLRPPEPAPVRIPAAPVAPVPPAPAAPAAPVVKQPAPEPVEVPVARPVSVREPPAPVTLATPAPAAPIEKSAPAPVRARSVPAQPAPQQAQAAGPRRPVSKVWVVLVLLLVLGGLAALFGPALLGMKQGGATPPSPTQPAPKEPVGKGAAGPRPVTPPGPTPVTTPPPRTEQKDEGPRNESLRIDIKPARTMLELTDPRGRQRKVPSPYVDSKPTPGVWHVVARAPGYEEERWTVEVTPGKPARLRARLTPSTGADSR
ncbi:protein kinase domain-containing protein [Archangium sp.]|uniref:serine/threonine-protein kinase n=1 Tax=Archangium sp. TaxID=1872627 RepID=UPI00286AC308|nr:protein kinase [Archangium sp.]